MGKFGVGQSIRRVEDQRFLTGRGRYTDDITVPGEAYLYILRSPYSHADIKSLDTAEARQAEGVIGVLTASELEAMDIGTIPVDVIPPNRDGSKPTPPPRPVLAKDRVRYVGEPVAAIVARTLNQAKDAADLIEIDYKERTPAPLHRAKRGR